MSLYPHLSKNPDGSYFVLICHADDSGSTAFTFSDIEYIRRSEINAHVSTEIHLGGDNHAFQSRLNLESASAREAYARALCKISKNKQEFDSYLSAAIVEVVRAIHSEPRMVDLVDAPPKRDEQWLLEPFVLDKAPNILFGEGGGGKTFVALRWLLSIATGIPFLGKRPARIVPCLFLDYEDSLEEGNDRIQKLCSSSVLASSGETPSLESLRNIKYFNARGVPLHDLIPTLKECIATVKIEFILIDSAVTACGGEPEKAEAAGRFFNSLAKLGVTTLTIAHETKSENHDHVFGSIFWRNFTRNMWNAQSEHDPVDSRRISFGLFHRKCNHAALHEPIPLRIFHGTGFVDIEKGEAEEWGGKSLTLKERIVKALRSGPKQFGQLVDLLRTEEEVKKDVVTMTLTRLRTRGILKQTGAENNYWEIA